MDCPSARSPESSGIASRVLNYSAYVAESILVSLSTIVGQLQILLVFFLSDLTLLKAFFHEVIASFVAVYRESIELTLFPPQSNRRLPMLAFRFRPQLVGTVITFTLRLGIEPILLLLQVQPQVEITQLVVAK